MSKITNDGLIRSDIHRMLYSCSTHMATVGVKGLKCRKTLTIHPDSGGRCSALSHWLGRRCLRLVIRSLCQCQLLRVCFGLHGSTGRKSSRTFQLISQHVAANSWRWRWFIVETHVKYIRPSTYYMHQKITTHEVLTVPYVCVTATANRKSRLLQPTLYLTTHNVRYGHVAISWRRRSVLEL